LLLLLILIHEVLNDAASSSDCTVSNDDVDGRGGDPGQTEGNKMNLRINFVSAGVRNGHPPNVSQKH
jgi:hypothetical protein